MRNVYIIATACTPFGKHADKSFQQLSRWAYLELLADAGLDSDGARLIEQAWFGNCGMGQWGQGGIRGQVAFTPLVDEGLFPERVPMINVEGGCATASFAFHGACKDILSGESEVSLAIGVEKLVSPDEPGVDPGEHLADCPVFASGVGSLEHQQQLLFRLGP
jgi:acetyl-CoA acetyltransferase